MAGKRIILGSMVVLLLFLGLVGDSGALTAADVLVVYNENFPGSREVAEYYLRRRDVPRSNLLGLALPETESISREEFETRLLAPLRVALRKLKKRGRKPIVLLVHGVPLLVRRPSGGRDDGEYRRLIRGKLRELGPLVRRLAGRLDALSKGEQARVREEEREDDLDAPAVLKLARESIIRALKSGAGRRLSPREKLSDEAREIQAIVLRLVGISRLAKNIEQQVENGALGLTEVLGNNALLKGSALLEGQLVRVAFQGVFRGNALDVASTVRASRGLLGELSFWYGLQAQGDSMKESAASVDSELGLAPALGGYRLGGWLPNPFSERFDRVLGIGRLRDARVMVARLDGPTAALARRLVDDALFAEKNGLEGVFYIDARGEGVEKLQAAYRRYDEYLLRLYDLLKKYGRMPVVLDKRPAVFAAGSCPRAALYCGWYSLGKYVAAFQWRRGAVGFHVASGEAVTLRRANSEAWCKRMIEEGVAATLGPVREPYLQSFPRPDRFFPLLMSAKLCLIEVYYRTIPYLSWQQVLIGDPLYNPFRSRPALREGWEKEE